MICERFENVLLQRTTIGVWADIGTGVKAAWYAGMYKAQVFELTFVTPTVYVDAAFWA